MSISSTVVSFFSYFQNLGCTISLPSIPIPDELRLVLDSVRNFLGMLMSLIPSIPPFDVRAQLIIMTVGIPLILDIVFVWFVQPPVTTIFHIIDLGAMFTCFMFLAWGAIQGYDALKISIAVIMGLWSFVRLILVLVGKCSSTLGLVQIARNVCNHYLSNIVPGMNDGEKEFTVDELNNIIQKFSKVVEIKPKPPSICGQIVTFIVATIMLLFSLWALDVIPIPIQLPATIKVIFPTIMIIFSFMFYLSFFLKFCECGRKFSMSLKQFCKRWGLRLLMMALELLYIPILSAFVSQLIFTKDFSCDYGYYRKNEKAVFDDSVNLIVHHNSMCTPCAMNTTLSEKCSNLCSGIVELRLKDDPSLLFINDVLSVSGGVLLYVVIFVMFGIPILWFYIIQRNKAFAYNVNIYGQDPETKWIRLVNRMKTTGIFLFVNYKFNTAKWSVFYLGVKFLVMIITTIAGRFWPYFAFILPFFYLVVLVCIIYYRPYLYTFNNILDSCLYTVQIFFSLIPIMSFFDVILPKSATMPLSIVVFVIPVLSIAFLLLFRQKSADFKEDPTYPEKLTEEEEAELDLKRKHARKKIERRKRAKNAKRQKLAKNADLSEDENDPFVLHTKHTIYPADDEPIKKDKNKTTTTTVTTTTMTTTTTMNTTQSPNAANGQNDVNGQQNAELNEVEFGELGQQFIEELDEKEAECLIEEDEATINPGDLMTVNEAIIVRRMKKNDKEYQIEGEPFTVNKRVMANRMTSMYEMLDIVVDGSTIDFLTTVLNVAISFAVAAFGWYVGALFFGTAAEAVCD